MSARITCTACGATEFSWREPYPCTCNRELPRAIVVRDRVSVRRYLADQLGDRIVRIANWNERGNHVARSGLALLAMLPMFIVWCVLAGVWPFKRKE